MQQCAACGAEVFPGATDCAQCGALVADAGARATGSAERFLSAAHVDRWPFRADVGLLRYALRAVAVGVLPSILLVVVVAGLAALAGIDVGRPPEVRLGAGGLVAVVVLAPLLETLLLAALLELLGMVLRSWARIAAVSAVAWGLLHGLVAPLWFFGTVWSFFVFGAAYIAWRPRSIRRAFVAAALPHAFINLAVFTVIYLGTRHS
jgi:hypothetical protein